MDSTSGSTSPHRPTLTGPYLQMQVHAATYKGEYILCIGVTFTLLMEQFLIPPFNFRMLHFLNS